MSQNSDRLLTRIVRPHILCDGCKSFWERATCLNFSSEELSLGGPLVPSMPQHLFHSSGRFEISTAAKTGCHFCSIILGCLMGCTGDHDAGWHHQPCDPIYISISILQRQPNVLDRFHSFIRYIPAPEDGSFILTLFSCERSKIVSHEQRIGCYTLDLRVIKDNTACSNDTDPDADAARLASNHTIDGLKCSRALTSTYSQTTGDLIKSWITDCQQNHEWCSDRQLSILHQSTSVLQRPRRLLDLQAFQTPDRVQLIEAEDGQDRPYCALSYSWGLSQPYLLTSANLHDFHNEIFLSNLPRTFQNAIEVARGIGLRYLWTDALCMMQDGQTSTLASDDWLDQASKMDEIFGSSVVTIAAAEAHNGSEGFILERNPLSYTICRLDLGTARHYQVIPPCTPHCVVHPFDNAQYHLDTRSWVLQERLLSARTIHFTRNFVHFECQTEVKCEAMSEASNCRQRTSMVKLDYDRFFALLPVMNLKGVGDYGVDVFLSTWHKLIRRYSTTNMSRATDLLVALAGLTKPLHQRFQVTWSFGLCAEFLLREMLWYVRYGTGAPARDRAPTWSWASIDLHGPAIHYDEFTATHLVAQITNAPDTTTFIRPVSPLKHESRFSVKLAGPMIFGIPSATRHRSAASPSSVSIKRRKEIRRHPFCGGLSNADCPFHPDYDLPSRTTHLYSLLVARGTDKRPSSATAGISGASGMSEVGLVLAPVPGHRCQYRRIGYFHKPMLHKTDARDRQPLPSLFDDSRCKVREIEII